MTCPASSIAPRLLHKYLGGFHVPKNVSDIPDGRIVDVWDMSQQTDVCLYVSVSVLLYVATPTPPPQPYSILESCRVSCAPESSVVCVLASAAAAMGRRVVGRHDGRLR